jgi:hypothetical protein
MHFIPEWQSPVATAVKSWYGVHDNDGLSIHNSLLNIVLHD